MLTEIYIEALLVDPEAADRVWEAWDDGEIDDVAAYLSWTDRHGLLTLRRTCWPANSASYRFERLR